MKDKQTIKSIKFKYIFSDDYNPIYINGAIGGINPRGEIIINFFLERNALPNSQTFIINEKGSTEKPELREPPDHENSFVRFIQNGVVLNLENAKEIHKWLGENIDQLDKALSEIKKQGK